MDITRLSQEGDLLRSGHQMRSMLNRVPITQQEAHIFVAQLKGWMGIAAKLVFGHLLDLPRRRRQRSRRSTCGQAGVARLALSAEERNIPIWLNTEMTELIMAGDRVVGVRVRKEGRELFIRGRKAVARRPLVALSATRKCASNTCPSRPMRPGVRATPATPVCQSKKPSLGNRCQWYEWGLVVHHDSRCPAKTCHGFQLWKSRTPAAWWSIARANGLPTNE